MAHRGWLPQHPSPIRHHSLPLCACGVGAAACCCSSSSFRARRYSAAALSSGVKPYVLLYRDRPRRDGRAGWRTSRSRRYKHRTRGTPGYRPRSIIKTPSLKTLLQINATVFLASHASRTTEIGDDVPGHIRQSHSRTNLQNKNPSSTTSFLQPSATFTRAHQPSAKPPGYAHALPPCREEHENTRARACARDSLPAWKGMQVVRCLTNAQSRAP
jgi:hypothetical protein